MRSRILLLLREALQPSKYREWSLRNGDRVRRDWATQAHLYSKYFLPVSSEEELQSMESSIYPKLDDNQKLAFKTFYLYKQDVLNGILGENFDLMNESYGDFEMGSNRVNRVKQSLVKYPYKSSMRLLSIGDDTGIITLVHNINAGGNPLEMIDILIRQLKTDASIEYQLPNEQRDWDRGTYTIYPIGLA